MTEQQGKVSESGFDNTVELGEGVGEARVWQEFWLCNNRAV
jgi:hypothetical protein